jgi:hypothetical protein
MTDYPLTDRSATPKRTNTFTNFREMASAAIDKIKGARPAAQADRRAQGSAVK